MKDSKRKELLFSATFYEYFSMIRGYNFVIGMIVLCLFFFSFGAIYMGNYVYSIGVICFVAGTACIPVIFLHRKLYLHMDVIGAAAICVALATSILDNSAIGAGLEVAMPLFLFAPVFFRMVMDRALICILFAVILPIQSALAADYQIHVVVLNFLMYIQFSVFALGSLYASHKLTASLYRRQLQIFKSNHVIENQKSKNEHLLENLFPPLIRSFVEEHKAENFPDATVIFADMDNFAEVAAILTPREAIDLMNRLFSLYDSLLARYNLLKVKTTGEVYIAVAGIPNQSSMAAIQAVQFALDAIEAVQVFASTTHAQLKPRIGIHTGFVVAGTLHTSKLTFDIYGDAVNVAHRMMYHGVPNSVQISVNTLRHLPATLQSTVLPAPTLAHLGGSEPLTPQSGTSSTAPATPWSQDTPRTTDELQAMSLALPASFAPNESQRLCRDWILHPRGHIELKHHGRMQVFLVSRPAQQEAEDENEPMSSKSSHLSSPHVTPHIHTYTSTSSTSTVHVPTPASPELSLRIVVGPEREDEEGCLSAPGTEADAPMECGDGGGGGGCGGGCGCGEDSAGGCASFEEGPSMLSVSASFCEPCTDRGQLTGRTASDCSSSDIHEDVFEDCLHRCNASQDVLTALRTAVVHQAAPQEKQSAGDRDRDGGRQDSKSMEDCPVLRPTQAPEITPASLVSAMSALRNQTHLLIWFKDPHMFPKYFKKQARESFRFFPLFFSIIVFAYVSTTVVHCLAFLHSVQFVLLTRLLAAGPSLLLSLLGYFHYRRKQALRAARARQCTRNGGTRAKRSSFALGIYVLIIFAIPWVVLSVSSAFELASLATWHRHTPTDPRITTTLQNEILATLWFSEMCIMMLLFSHCVIYSHTLKFIILTVSFAFPMVFLLLTQCIVQFFYIPIVSIIWVMSMIYISLVESLDRTAFLQTQDMKKRLSLVREANVCFDRLLHSTMPSAVLRQLKSGHHAISQRIPEATVFFADIVKFTQFCSNVPSVFVVQLLDKLYARFDQICEQNGCTSIMTIGDCYFAGSGLIRSDEDQTYHSLLSAVEMIHILKQFNAEQGIDLSLRVGLSTGVVFAGVLGMSRFTYDVWGPAVVKAKQLEAASGRNRLLISSESRARLPSFVRFREGPIVAQAQTYFVNPACIKGTSHSHSHTHTRTRTRSHTRSHTRTHTCTRGVQPCGLKAN